MSPRRIDPWLLAILAAGLGARLLFLLVLAPWYYGRPDIRVDGDTYAWFVSFQNLMRHGVYTVDPANEWGYFARMPGYSFFIGAFYLLLGQDMDRAYTAVSWAQTLGDVGNIVLVYLIARKALVAPGAPRLAAALYASYPFVIVWTPVVYSEWLGVTLALVSVAVFVCARRPWSDLGAGLALGLSILSRPQAVVLVGPFLLVMLLGEGRRVATGALRAAALLLGVAITYGPWPARNLLLQHKVVPFQDLRGFDNWSGDVIAFMQYMFSIKAEWEPQFGQLIRNRPVVYPEVAYSVPGDAALLERATRLAQDCSRGFSYWRGYWKEPLQSPGCGAEVMTLFQVLREHQIEHQPWNFWVAVPLQNLRKALFKTNLYDTGSAARRLASNLFLWRSLLIVLGLLAGLWLVKQRQDPAGVSLLAVTYAVSWYVMLCVGTQAQLRNIEMRYLLLADVLLLLPAAEVCARGLAALARNPRTRGGLARP